MLKYVTLSHEILGHMGIHFWDVCYFENISLADYFAIKTKIAVKYILKLWLFEIAKCYGSHFEKNGPERLCHFAILLSNGGLD